MSNGDQARYGSITSQWEHFALWKRNAETDKARLDAQALLDGMLAKERLLDLVQNFILFDASRAGGTRKVVAVSRADARAAQGGRAQPDRRSHRAQHRPPPGQSRVNEAVFPIAMGPPVEPARLNLGQLPRR